MTELAVRQATERDVAETAALLRAVFAAEGTPNEYVDDVTNVARRLRDAEVFVALEDDHVVGTATLYGPVSNRHSYPSHVVRRPWPPTWAVFRALAVDPAHRRKGVARRLIDQRIARARELGARAIALHIGTEHETVRSALFLRRGWERAPRYDFFPLRDVRVEAYVLVLQ
jgi:predicted N-acetyltransferase YhbS